MQIVCEVQAVRPARDYRDKNGNNHRTIDIVVVDKGSFRVTGIGLVWSVEEGKDPEMFKLASSLGVDSKLSIGVDGLRNINGEYRMSGHATLSK